MNQFKLTCQPIMFNDVWELKWEVVIDGQITAYRESFRPNLTTSIMKYIAEKSFQIFKDKILEKK